MSREIKFRAWTGKEMIYDALSAKIMPASTFDNIEFPAYYAAGMKTCNMQELMQFTGLRDANGVEVFDGDVIVDEEGYLSKIYWSEKDFMWCASDIGGLCELAGCDFKVIGNIYKHPHLLDGAK